MIDDVDDTFCYSIGQNTTEIGSNLSEFQWVDQDFEGHLWRFAGAYKQAKGEDDQDWRDDDDDGYYPYCSCHNCLCCCVVSHSHCLDYPWMIINWYSSNSMLLIIYAH